MRVLPKMACMPLAILLSACVPSDVYYDDNGNYVPPPNATTQAQRIHAPNPGMDRNDSYYSRHYSYDRAGYYDSNGYIIEEDDSLNIPGGMLPPRGMCRVWFADRSLKNQPRIESCGGIKQRVPTGAYVIYGG